MNTIPIIWLTGLSGAGKSTLANGLHKLFSANQMRSIILDGDVLRAGINSDLGFSPEDRSENLRRVTEIIKLFAGAEIIPIISVISPYQKDRNSARYKLNDYKFIEVYVKCSLATCESRDPKGLYKKVREQSIANFTGISDIYEPPVSADLVIDTEEWSYVISLEALWGHVSKCIYEQPVIKEPAPAVFYDHNNINY